MFLSSSIETAEAQAAKPAAEPAMEHGPSGPLPPGPKLTISYQGKSESWTAPSLAALDHAALSVYNEHLKAKQDFAGVPLMFLLTRLGVPDKPHGKDFRIYLVAEGSDGYQVVYSLGEVSPDVHDGTTLVADTLDKEPLPGNGSFQLVTTGEKRPARWVRNLVSIRVLTAP
jgi:hypothetical protein